MESIVGPTSFMYALYFSAWTIVALKYNCKKICENTVMFALQWATQELTNDDSIFLSPKVLKVNSIADLNPKLFGAQPEFSYFIQKEKIAMHPLNIG